MPVPYDNKRIIRPGTKHKWTPEMAKELKGCKDDLMYFALNHVKVQTVDRGVSSLDFRPYQERLFKAMLTDNRMIVISPRQTGKCGFFGTKIRIRNKINGLEEEITIGEFFKRMDSLSR
jgi:hypothetical protein